MKRIAPYLCLPVLLSTWQVSAQSYYLLPNETVSELLYVRLKISPIYKGGYLQEVLKYNNISLEESKKLPAGKEIRLPLKEVARVSEPVPKPEPEPVSELGDDRLSWYLEAGAVIEQMSSDLETSDFNSTLFYPHLHLGYVYHKSGYKQTLEGHLSFVTIEKDEFLEGSNQLLNSGLEYQILKPMSEWYFGIGFRLQQTPLIMATNDEENYELKNPMLFSIVPALRWDVSAFQNGFHLFYTPSHEGLGAEVESYYSLDEDKSLGLTVGYQGYSVEENSLEKLILKVAYRYSF